MSAPPLTWCLDSNRSASALICSTQYFIWSGLYSSGTEVPLCRLSMMRASRDTLAAAVQH